ncbi:hypothetical protein [Bacillus sp. AFS017336]|uniref:hypothetical protein n=1 Tax=Bacillus sp. AFS017336 TaxID=2033489 RepID=UPI000BEFB801|nr:hypothetical protein [Bacillus sp. AFS017336]PEL10251.1 hypothetical protein CN601_14035 [Bacillus sp. AFS017336]
MEPSIETIALRKLLTTILTTLICSIVFSSIAGASSRFEQQTDYIQTFLIYVIYGGGITLVYGNIVSVVVELLQYKWFKQQNWLYILILGLFGLVFSFIGFTFSLLYGLIDKWLNNRMVEKKPIAVFFLIPILSFGVIWVSLYATNDSYTEKAAISLLVNDLLNDKKLEHLPKQNGTWEGEIKGYQVKTETNAVQSDSNEYHVTFIEIWKKGNEENYRKISVYVQPNSIYDYTEEGSKPPY